MYIKQIHCIQNIVSFLYASKNSLWSAMGGVVDVEIVKAGIHRLHLLVVSNTVFLFGFNVHEVSALSV